LPWLNGRIEDIPRGEVVRTREGIRVRVMPDGMYYNVFYWGDYEPYNTKIYRRIVSEGDVVFDIGANFGWYSTLFARWVGEGGRVHAFEPVPFIHALAVETLALNQMSTRVQLNRFGLGRDSESIPMYTYTGLPHGHATAIDLGRKDAVIHPTRFQRLDEYCEENAIASVRFMKVDVEGFERDVFEGGELTLSREDAPIIAFEVNGDCLRHRHLRGGDVIDTLRELGYTDFFAFSTRHGVRRLESRDLEGADCLAAKPRRMDELRPALQTGRLTVNGWRSGSGAVRDE
jgi:FkbM family methyltransferase